MKVPTKQERLVALKQKLGVYEEKLARRLKNFRGVPHESASGELSFSELKVLEDFVTSIKAEIKALESEN